MAYDPLPAADIRMSLQRRHNRPTRIEKAKDPRRSLARLARYLRPYRWELGLVAASVLVASLLGLVGPYLMGRAIDGAIAQSELGQLARIALLMLGAYAFANLSTVAANWLMAGVSQNALKKLRADLFGHLQTLPMSFFDTQATGGLMSRLTSDIDAVNQAISQNVTAFLSGALSMAGILVAMFFLNYRLALGCLVVIPIMVGFSRFVAAYTRQGFRELQKRLGFLYAEAEEAISGQKVIQAFGRGGQTAASFRERNQAVYEAAVKANSYAMLLMPLTGVLGSFFVIVLAALGGFLALQGLATVGIIATFIQYAQNFTQPLRQLANLYNTIQAALAGAERVFEIIDTPGESDIGADGKPRGADKSPGGAARLNGRLQGDVCFRGVSFGYKSGIPVIRDFSLDVAAGQTVALVGPTGAGKTTIINLLSRFYEIDVGAILIDGVDIRDYDRGGLRRNLGMVLQDTFLFADTVMENIHFGRLEASDDDCREAARLAEADHFIRQLPEGYGANLSERAGNLSQGQRQLLSIARAVLADPAVLVLDEATSSVDTRTELRLQHALLRLRRGRTSIVIAHRLSTIRDADLVVVIDDGRIVEKGSHQELLDRRGFYYRLYLSQFKGREL